MVPGTIFLTSEHSGSHRGADFQLGDSGDSYVAVPILVPGTIFAAAELISMTAQLMDEQSEEHKLLPELPH